MTLTCSAPGEYDKLATLYSLAAPFNFFFNQEPLRFQLLKNLPPFPLPNELDSLPSRSRPFITSTSPVSSTTSFYNASLPTQHGHFNIPNSSTFGSPYTRPQPGSDRGHRGSIGRSGNYLYHRLSVGNLETSMVCGSRVQRRSFQLERILSDWRCIWDGERC